MTKTQREQNPTSVIFAPRSWSGRLATNLKKKEEELSKTLKTSVRVVEEEKSYPVFSPTPAPSGPLRE